MFSFAMDRTKTPEPTQAEIARGQQLYDTQVSNARADAIRQQNQQRADAALALDRANVLTDAAQARTDAAANRVRDLSDYGKKSEIDLGNQKLAWESASKFKQSDAAQQITANKELADQSNVAQKDRLGLQTDTQKDMQRAGIDQVNKLRRDDNQRAIDGFRM